MVGTLTSISCGNESLSIQVLCCRCRRRPPRISWDRSVAQPAKYFCGGARAIGTFPEKYWAVRCHATALWSPFLLFCLGRILQVEYFNITCGCYAVLRIGIENS